MDQPDVSVVIVAWNGRDILLRCLAALHTQPQGARFETLVIDNASSDGTADAIAQAFPGVRLERNAYNRGFARAVNQGLRRSRGRYALLLNPDTLPGSDLLGRLVRYMDGAPEAGLAGVQLLREDGSKQNSIDNDPTLLQEIVSKSLLRRWFPERYPGKRQSYAAPLAVETVIGACLIARREAMDDAGLLDEGYFLFLEETCWCGSMRRAGWQVMHLPDVSVIHLQGKSKDVAPARARIEYLRSLFRYYRRNRGTAVWALVRLIRLLRSLIDLVTALVACCATGFLREPARRRLRSVAVVTGWQLLGCPAGIGLQPQAWRDERPERAPELAAEALRDLDALSRRPGMSVVKDVRIKRLLRWQVGAERWFLKVYRARAGWRAPAAWCFGTRAEQEDAAAREAAARGVPALVPGGCWVRREGIWPRESAVAVRERADAVPLDRFLREEAEPARRRRVLAAYGRYARRVHDAGVHQDDFDPNNALLEWQEGQPVLLLIDHERVTLRPPLSASERRWNLAKLHRFPDVTWSERARFVRAYVGRGLPGCADWRAWARQVLAEFPAVRHRDFRRAVRAAFRADRNVKRLRTETSVEAWGTPARDPLAQRTWTEADLAGLLRGTVPTGGELLVHPEPDAGAARRIWASALGLARVRAPIVPLRLMHAPKPGNGAQLTAVDVPGSQPLLASVRAAAAADRIPLAVAFGRCLGRLEALGVVAPWATGGAAIFPDAEALRTARGPDGSWRVRFVPFREFVVAPRPRGADGATERCEMLARWLEHLRARAGWTAPESQAAAEAFAATAGLPARDRQAFVARVLRALGDSFCRSE